MSKPDIEVVYSKVRGKYVAMSGDHYALGTTAAQAETRLKAKLARAAQEPDVSNLNPALQYLIRELRVETKRKKS